MSNIYIPSQYYSNDANGLKLFYYFIFTFHHSTIQTIEGSIAEIINTLFTFHQSTSQTKKAIQN